MCKEGVYAYAFQTGKSGFISPLRLPFVHCIFGRIGAWIPFRILVPASECVLQKILVGSVARWDQREWWRRKLSFSAKTCLTHLNQSKLDRHGWLPEGRGLRRFA